MTLREEVDKHSKHLDAVQVVIEADCARIKCTKCNEEFMVFSSTEAEKAGAVLEKVKNPQATYHVVWEIDIDADSPEEAVVLARDYQLNSDCTIYTARKHGTEEVEELDYDVIDMSCQKDDLDQYL